MNPSKRGKRGKRARGRERGDSSHSNSPPLATSQLRKTNTVLSWSTAPYKRVLAKPLMSLKALVGRSLILRALLVARFWAASPPAFSPRLPLVPPRPSTHRTHHSFTPSPPPLQPAPSLSRPQGGPHSAFSARLRTSKERSDTVLLWAFGTSRSPRGRRALRERSSV